MNSINNTESASQIGYNNSASGLTATDVQGAVDELAQSYPADKVMMSDGVTSVEDELDRKNKSAVNNLVDIKIYNSNNPYICPSDGYLRICSTSTNVDARGHIFNDSSSATTNYTLLQSQGLYVSAFVRKGAKVFADGTVYAAHFLKLE